MDEVRKGSRGESPKGRAHKTYCSNPLREQIQADGRIRRWVKIEEMEGRYLRVVLLPDGETVHNAFFDRRFEP